MAFEEGATQTSEGCAGRALEALEDVASQSLKKGCKCTAPAGVASRSQLNGYVCRAPEEVAPPSQVTRLPMQSPRRACFASQLNGCIRRTPEGTSHDQSKEQVRLSSALSPKVLRTTRREIKSKTRNVLPRRYSHKSALSPKVLRTTS